MLNNRKDEHLLLHTCSTNKNQIFIGNPKKKTKIVTKCFVLFFETKSSLVFSCDTHTGLTILFIQWLSRDKFCFRITRVHELLFRFFSLNIYLHFFCIFILWDSLFVMMMDSLPPESLISNAQILFLLLSISLKKKSVWFALLCVVAIPRKPERKTNGNVCYLMGE